MVAKWARLMQGRVVPSYARHIVDIPAKTRNNVTPDMAEFRIGKRAPNFSLEATDGSGTRRTRVSLDDYLDGWLVLLFYPRDFSMI